jgi:hypothetical protein
MSGRIGARPDNERLLWIETWATGWSLYLGSTETSGAQRPLEVATSMILELVTALRYERAQS